jgi:hypothetical protein
MAATKKKKKKKDEMDGAQFLYGGDGKTPADYMDDPVTGLRGKASGPPAHTVAVSLKDGVGDVTLPPRSIWQQGKYKSDSDQSSPGYSTWVVSGEGTPGNYATREYKLPADIAVQPLPKHPADWTKAQKEKSWGKNSGTKKSETTSSLLPFGIRFRDPNCGHWFRESDLAGHAKVCPGFEGGESDWAIECECCTSLDDTAKCKPGFPRAGSPAQKASEEAAKPKPKPEPKVAAQPGGKEK